MDALRKIETLFARVRAENDEPSEQPGLNRQLIQSEFTGLGLSPPAELVQLYEWRNGIYHLNAFLHFLSLSDAVDAYRRLDKFKRVHEDVPWEFGWFPVLDMNGDIQVCVDLASGALFCVDQEDGRSWPLAPSYQNCLDALTEGFSAGAFEFNSDAGAFKASALWGAIALKHQIGGFW
jgi:hypothetical protein